MADRSKVAEAYAEVRADLSKLPGDMGKVPGLVKQMLSTQGLKAIRDVMTGNITQGLVSMATRGYELQAERLKELSDQAGKAAKGILSEADAHEKLAAKLDKEAEAWAKLANDKSASQANREHAAGMALSSQQDADYYAQQAARKRARGDALAARSGKFGDQARTAEAMGESVGNKVRLASQIGIMAIKAVAAIAAAYFATTVIAAKRASENLKTAQLVRATGEAAGWSTTQLKHMGEQLRKNTQFSASQISGAQQALLNHPNIKGAEFDKALKTAANIAAVYGKELPQAASELGEILADPIKAAEGALEKYSVLLDGVEQGQIRNAVAARDWEKAQNIILGHLKRFDGAAQEAAETGTGGFEKLKNSLLSAAGIIGGMNGDIGKLAARVADAIDKFMALQIVKDILSLATAQWRELYNAVSRFIEDNRADVERWAGQVSEIYHNVRDQVIQAWEATQRAAKQVMDWILAQTGTTWGDIKKTITETLDEVSLLTADFGLTAKYVWLKIQLGAQNLWDAIRDGAAGIAIAFESAWEAIGKGATAAWNNIKATFTGGDTVSIADEMAKGWNEAFAKAASKYNLGDSDAAKEIRAQIDKVRAEMQEARDKIRQQREANKPKDPDMTPNGDKKYKNTKPFQFEFIGFEELSKKIQTALQPDSKEFELQKAGVAAAERAANAGEEGNKKLGEIKDGINKWGFGFAP